jgi:predicted ABC-type ATPase
MIITSENFIQSWKDQYAPNADIWKQYPEVDRQHFLSLVAKDEEAIRAKYLDSLNGRAKDMNPFYVATAGAPLAGKTTLLDQFLENTSRIFGRVDPDPWGMLEMQNAYIDYLMNLPISTLNLKTGKNRTLTKEEIKYEKGVRAYNVARPASNYITLKIQNELAERGHNIAHGTTLTSPHIRHPLTALKAKGYQVHILLCGAPDEVRLEGQDYRAREQGYYQATPEDVIQKGEMFPQRFEDYFAFADSMDMYWRIGVTEDAILAASYSYGQMEIFNLEAYFSFINKYNQDRVYLARKDEPVTLPDFSEHESAFAKRFSQADYKFRPQINAPV